MVEQAIILAGGKGERLRPLTEDRPKPMIEVNGKPIICYQLEQFKEVGVKEVVIACSYLKEALKGFIGDGSKFGVSAHYSEEEKPLGRGGGIKQAMKLLSGDWKNILISNGDNLWKIDLDDLVKEHEDRNAVATITVVPLKSPYGIVEFNEHNEIKEFREKPVLPHWVNAGVYVFSREIMHLLPDIGDHETETFPMLPKKRFLVFESTNYWRGIDTIKDLTEAQQEIKNNF